MVDVLTGIGLDEYDEVYSDIMRLTPIFHLPDEMRTQLFFAFGELAKKCRTKDKMIETLSLKLDTLTEKMK